MSPAASRRPATDDPGGRPRDRRPWILLVLAGLGVALLLWLAWGFVNQPSIEPGPEPQSASQEASPNPASPVTAPTPAATSEGGVEARVELPGEATNRDTRHSYLVGRVLRQDRGLIGVVVEVIAGIDRGAVAVTNSNGIYRLGPLYPGVAIVRFSATGRLMAERPLLIRRRGTTPFDLDATAGATMAGRVVGSRNAPLAGVRVHCDGSEILTGGDGTFILQRTANGPARVTIEYPGFAPHDCATWSSGEPTFHLVPGGTLEVTLPGLEVPGEVHLYVLPASLDRAPAWPLAQPILTRCGTTVVLRDLPRADVEVRAFHAFAHAGPVGVNIRPDVTGRVTIEWQVLPTLTGRVVDADGPVAGAAVELRADDLHDALFVALGRARPWLQRAPMSWPPAAWQRAVTDRDGRFRFGLPQLHNAGVEVEARVGARRVGRRLEAGTRELELTLLR